MVAADGSGADHDVIVIGGGLAGLAAARVAHEAGKRVAVFEASDQVGGRARTDVVDGFLIDRGFQVLLTSYPQARRQLDYDALELSEFEPGATVWNGDRMTTMADPLRRKLRLPESVMSPIGTLGDKLKVLGWRRRVTRGRNPYAAMFQVPETSALEALRDREGFTREMIDGFLRPFYSGILLENELASSSRMLDFTFRMFATGAAALPARGMGQLAYQMLAYLPPASVRLNSPVVSIDGATVTLADGTSHIGHSVVVAVDGWSAHELLGESVVPDVGAAATACLWFAAPHSPAPGKMLVLNGAGPGDGPVNNVAVVSDVAPGYAPTNSSLVAVSLIGIPGGSDSDIENAVRKQLSRWFGAGGVGMWRLLSLQRITHALPDQSPPWLTQPSWPVELAPGRYICGDYRDTASIDGALRSGAAAGARAAAYVSGA
ncbi:MAG: FAD-dependent oxidoreductase [Thermoleophilia bacterium]|nr:FAD-dependent oxidoreductase [Thermoleophilia bacterium]